jgi:hypothetical protein
VPWDVFRVATSEYFGDSLHEIKTRWTMTDLRHAHAVIDALADAEAAAHPGGE